MGTAKRPPDQRSRQPRSITWLAGLLGNLALLLLLAFPVQAGGEAAALRVYGRAQRLLSQGQTAAALGEFARAVRLAPGDLGMRTRLAWLLLDLGRPEAALPHFERLLAQRPDHRDALVGLAIAQLRLGHPDLAVPVLDQGLRFYPQDTLLLKLKGEALASRPETAAAAVKVFDELSRRQPREPEWVRQRQAAARKAAALSYRQALKALQQDRQALAWQKFQESLDLDPEAIGYRTHYGWALLEAGQPGRAAPVFAEVLRRDPGKQDAYLGLAWSRLGLGDVPGALRTAQQGLEKFPEDPQLLEVRADAAAARPETWAAAQADYQHLKDQQPDNFQLRLKLGRLLEARGQTRGASRLFQEVLAAAPGHLEAHLALGRLCLQSEAYGLAARHFRQVLRADPDHRGAKRGLRQVEEALRPQVQTYGGYFEDADTFQRSHVYSSCRYYLTESLKATLGYGYLAYDMGNDARVGRTRERPVHRHVLPLKLHWRAAEPLVLEAGGALSAYGATGTSGAARAGLYWQATARAGLALSYTYYDVIDFYGPFQGPWGRHLEDFADFGRYRYYIVDPVAFWTQNIFGASSTQAITRHIRAHEVGVWGYQDLPPRLSLCFYGALGPYSDGNFKKTVSATLSCRLLHTPLLRLKYSFYYLGFRQRSARLADLPWWAAALYFDPIAFKNHSWGLVWEHNLSQRLKVAGQVDLLYNAGARRPGVDALLEVNYLLTPRLSFRAMAFYLHSVNEDGTTYQVRNVMAGLSLRF